ncbi:uncharacterized protein LOC100374058 [Saccoglossus kowalevskii]|uniref:Peripheral myelin protein 22-like n=1 Tax=Saccoglossus kowalevskii TaxID=10224 RepID=A0ABM0GJ69_SACKO|nr:PREDICTED: peripheral myelin protein 22-like [Saccoglossus kowalevskii]
MQYVSFREISPTTVPSNRENRLVVCGQVCGLALTLVITGGILLSTATNHWAHDADDVHFGLWKVCQREDHRAVECLPYVSVPEHVYVCRIFMVSACALSSLSFICAGYGFLWKHPQRIYVAAGFMLVDDLFVFAGTVIFTAYYYSLYSISYGVIVAWVMMPLALITAAMFLLSSRRRRPGNRLLRNATAAHYGSLHRKQLLENEDDY